MYPEPVQIQAGDTAGWSIDAPVLSDGTVCSAANGWALSYVLLGAAGKIAIDAAEDGAGFAVDEPAVTTAAWAEGLYAWTLFAAKDPDRYTIRSGQVEILADPAAEGTTAADARSHARRTLEAIEAVLEKRATKDQMGYTLGSRRLDRTPVPDLLQLRDRYRAEVAAEERRARVAAGRARGGRQIKVRL
jgi:hypothetical protein